MDLPGSVQDPTANMANQSFLNPWDVSTSTQDMDNYGLPAANPTPDPPGIQMTNPNAASTGGILDSIKTFGANAWETVKDDGNAVIDAVEHGAEDGYTTTKNALGSAVNSVGSAAKSIVSFGTGQIMFLLLGVGVVIYLAGKSGALKISKV